MRGSRDEILTRLQAYEPFVKKVLEDANGGKCVALDLGCGRGEWLQFLNDRHSIQSIGIDNDESMVAVCRQLGLQVCKCDALDYLRQAESDSVDLVSMFQVAEHLDWEAFANALVEIRRILRPGGGIIVETPNPENMIVGACNFYFDPTHVRQIPPLLMKNVFVSAGFDDVEIIRSNRYPAVRAESLGEGTAENVIREVASFFNNFADYAALGFKGK